MVFAFLEDVVLGCFGWERSKTNEQEVGKQGQSFPSLGLRSGRKGKRKMIDGGEEAEDGGEEGRRNAPIKCPARGCKLPAKKLLNNK